MQKSNIVMWRLIPVLFFLLILISCNKPTEYTGSLIPRDSFVVILKDIHVADAVYTHFILNEARPTFNQGMLYLDVFKKHNTDKESFQKTFDYYARNISEFDLICDDVVSLLSIADSSQTKTDSLDIKP